jgi:hypothetical protein
MKFNSNINYKMLVDIYQKIKNLQTNFYPIIAII